jgi:hypothetical protein
MYSSVDAPLPDSSEVVNHKNAMTNDEAISVTTAGTELITSVVQPLAMVGYQVRDDDEPRERWAGCQAAQQKIFGDGQDNGVRYVARVRLQAPRDVQPSTVADAVTTPGITWNQDAPTTTSLLGDSGIFKLSIATSLSEPRDVTVQVSSPCYFLRKVEDGEGGSVSSEDVAKVTGFTSRDLVLPT